jgi:hypothetical protein
MRTEGGKLENKMEKKSGQSGRNVLEGKNPPRGKMAAVPCL